MSGGYLPDGPCLDCGIPRVRFGRCVEHARAFARAKWRKAHPRYSCNRYDWVVVYRLINGQQPGRAVTINEKRETVRLILRAGGQIAAMPIAGAVNPITVRRWVDRFRSWALEVGLDKPLRIELPDHELVSEEEPAA